jgi:DNA-binding XRE family transcriptional regulator
MVTQRSNALLIRARQTLGWTQQKLADKIGSSQRTVLRMENGHSTFHATLATQLAPHVYPLDRELAADLLSLAGQTLIGAGLEAAPASPAAPAPPPLPSRPAQAAVLPPPVPAPDVLAAQVDAIVCAAAEAADVSPRVVRGSVLLVMRRVLELRLDLRAALAAGLLGGDAAGVGVEAPRVQGAAS